MSIRRLLSSSAQVHFELQVRIPVSYGPDWKLEDKHQQIIREATESVQQALRGHGIAVQTCEVIAVTTHSEWIK